MKWAVTVLLLTTCYLKAAGFQLPSATTKSNRSTRLRSTNQDNEQGERQPESKRKQQEETSKFLTDFKTASGNVVDPYKILKVPRSATTVEIKQSYRKLTKKLHPDAVARKEILPGNW
jgi:DnaJ-domain-containing protein 1